MEHCRQYFGTDSTRSGHLFCNTTVSSPEQISQKQTIINHNRRTIRTNTRFWTARFADLDFFGRIIDFWWITVDEEIAAQLPEPLDCLAS